ncbi:apolipoprotein Bb, tandem duplicate 1 [Spinachia spinachia]
MMGDPKLCFLLLLSTSALAFAQDQDQPTCLLAKRYKTLHKYEYRYEAESLNSINGGSQLKNGPMAFCTVEIEVPQTCSFIVRTTGCILYEVVDMEAEGIPVFSRTPSSDAFAAEMEKYPLKVVVSGVYDVKLYPEDGETTTILNIKRGIISAFAVPLLEEEKNPKMPTIHGKCKTYSTVNAREDIATDISLERDLSRCDKFVPLRDHTSPLALISGMHYPLAQMVRSSQTCNYKFDNVGKHMTSGSCTENHIIIPFSHKGEYGVTNVGKQKMTLLQLSPHNDRVFDHGDIVKGLHMDTVEDKSVVQDKDAGLNLLRELATLPETEGERRAHLFQQLVTMVRGMKAETLSTCFPEALAVSRVLTYQVLAQCGTPECSSTILQILRTFDRPSAEVDAGVFAMGLVSNPSALLINDMLEMVKYKRSKPIMYALSNIVKRFYKAEGKLIPEIYSVAEVMASYLGDCSGDMDNTFLTLRVVGNMAPALIPAGPTLTSAVIQCVNQPAASPAVQQAAIQVFRLTPVPEEGRKILTQVLLDGASPIQKRIAAYLVLMRDPKSTELAQLADALAIEQDTQFKTFVISHITNILSSTEPETQELRQKIRDAVQSNELGQTMHPTKFSRNYKIGSVEGNMIFEGTSYLPKEVMLEMTLKAFGYDIDMMEIGMEGKGFEPTVDALFGKNGFFPSTALKTMYFVSDNMPLRINEILQNIVPGLEKDMMKGQASQNLIREIGRNLNKLVTELSKAQSPEAMVYLRLLGNELGYLRSNEMEEMAYSAARMIDSMFKMFPTDIMMALMTKADNTIFAHYIFMDNEFFLPTATGVPLRITVSGTFTPGLKGGLQVARDMTEVNFMPSASIEFLSQIGSFIPEYVNSGLEMHSNFFHESGLKAKISMERDNVKLTIPAPTNPIKLIRMTNTLVGVTGSKVKAIPLMLMDKVDVSECTAFFAGMKYCTALQYTDAFYQETAPYFPITGDSKFAVELHPNGDVTEYTATVAYELLKEGEEGRQKVDSVKFVLRAEGSQPTEATAIMKYNRRKNVITADIQIPDYDVEAGLRLGLVDGNTKGTGTHSISLDFINKNIPQLSLVGRANLKAMKEGMLQVQLLVPSINADATITANMKRDEELELELKSEIKVMAANSGQRITVKYDASHLEFAFKSEVNADTTSLPTSYLVEKYGNPLLDTRVGQTDMKVRHIFKKFVEAANNYMEKYGADLPYIQSFRVPDMPEISLPETLFLNNEAKAVYYFNNERFTIDFPLLFGGKSTKELNFPPVLTTPALFLHDFGLEIHSMEIPIPELVVPESFSLSIPLFGKAEVSTLMKSNLYDMKASMAAGKDVVETPSYSAKFDVTGTSPVDILSINIEGSGMLATSDSIKVQLKSSLTHAFLDAMINIVEDVTITDKIKLKSSSKIEATSPLGLNISLEHNGMTAINTEAISASSHFEGSLTAGPIYGKTISFQSFNVFPFRPEAKIDSTVKLDSTIGQAENTIAATLANGEFSVMSNTNAFEDTLTHLAELSFKDSRLSLKCDVNAFALGMKIRNQAETSASADEVLMRMETNADHSESRVYSLLTASLDVSGLAVNSDATMKLVDNEATHKATLKMNKDGLTTSGTTTLQSPLSLENTFNAGLDASMATLSITNKAAIREIKVDNANHLTITLSGLDFNSKAEVTGSDYATYTHDITANMKAYTASANVKNNLKLLAAQFVNEAQLQADLRKIDLTGSLKAMCGEEEIKHTYQVNYADMIVNAKCSTTGKVMGTHMSQNTDLELVGLAARITNEARFNSQPMRFDHTIRSSIVPFNFYLNAIFNADGDMVIYGQHSAQLYGKYLLKVQPLAFATQHECRASIKQQLDSGFALETTFDNKMDTLLSLQEQRTSHRIKSKMNNHAFNQDISLYNTAERAGIEVSGTILTNMLNEESNEDQEFTIASFLKYDKNTESQIILFPLIEYLPAFLETIKGVVVHVAEALQKYINREEIRATLEALPQHVNDFVSGLNIEGKAVQLNLYFSDLSQANLISMEDVETLLTNLKVTVKNLLADLSFYFQHFAGMVKEIIVSVPLPETLIPKIQEHLNAIIEQYNIKSIVVDTIAIGTVVMDQIQSKEIYGDILKVLRDLDYEYDFLDSLKIIMSELKQMIENFTMQDLRKCISSFDFETHLERLLSYIQTFSNETFSIIIDQIREIILDLDVGGKINTFYAKMREFIVKFDADKRVQAVLEGTVELIKKLRIEESIRDLLNMVKKSYVTTKLMRDYAVQYLKTTKVKDVIQHLNMLIEEVVRRVRTLDYNEVVDHANEFIRFCTHFVNLLIRTFEIPQKLEATRDFINLVLSSVRGLMDNLREIKAAELVKSVKNILDRVVFDNVKTLAEYMKEEIIDLDVIAEITSYLNFVVEFYTIVITEVNDIFIEIVETIKDEIPELKIITEIQQIIEGLSIELKKAELNTPSFIMPLTDLIVPSVKFSMDQLRQFEIPNQMEIPEFTIVNFYTVEARTISFNDIKQRIVDIFDFFVNLEIQMSDVDAFFGDLTINYLLFMPEMTLPEISLDRIVFPTIPYVPVERFPESFQLLEFSLPTIPTEITVPCFGKLYGEIKFQTPIYNFKTSAEFQNSTEGKTTPQFTGSITSQATSPSFEILNYKLDSTARIAIPKFNRVVLAETFKLNHLALGVEHQASLTLYGLSAQAQGKTTIKVITAPYTADLRNIAFFALEGGMSGSLDTTYNHVVDLPIVNIRSEATVTQRAIARQNANTLSLTVDNSGTAKLNAEDGTHKSNLQLSLNPSICTLTFSGDTDSTILKMKQLITAESHPLYYVKFNIRNEAEAPVIKNSLIVASGHANLHDIEAELKANHYTELYGSVTGALSNEINIMVRPVEFVFEFQNKGNTKVNIFETLIAKIDLQNDYSATFKPDSQKMNSVLLARLNQNKMFYNFTVDNNEKEAGIFVVIEDDANLDFLTSPISLPEIDLPFIDFNIPAISDLNLYEQTGLKNILTTTEQSVTVDAKIVYHKSLAAPLVDMMGLIQIPAVGNLLSELSFKSAIINLNVNAGLYAEDDLVFRLGATTASVFEGLKAKLDGTASLTSRRGFKLANSLSLENPHIQGTHDSAISMSAETFETTISVATVGKIILPILSLEANQNLVADNKDKANAVSTFSMKGDVNIPVIAAVGKAEADHSLKLEGCFEYVSMESSTKANMDGTLLDNYLLLGVLDSANTLYFNKDGLRSTSKVIADAKLDKDSTTVIGMDVKENSAVEASLNRVYALLEYNGNNEANLFDFHTKGKQDVKVTIDLSPTSSLTAKIEIIMSQPSSLGDFSVFEKIVAEVTAFKQNISANCKFVSPLYTTDMAAEVEGEIPAFKVTLKSSATSVIVLLEYDMDASTTVNVESQALNMESKVVLTHTDITLDATHVITQALSRHTLNVDITSPTFTDANLRYAAGREGITASASTPTTGFLGFQFSGRVPSQMTARVYVRYPFAPDIDSDMLVIRTTSKEAAHMNLHISYNMEAPTVMLDELKRNLPSIISTFTIFADKYQITSKTEALKNFFVNPIREAYDAAINYDSQMSQLSIFFRNTIVQYHQSVQVFLDAVVKVLKETQFKLPGSDEMTTLPVVLKNLASSFAAFLDMTVQTIWSNMEVYYNAFVEQISSVKLHMPDGGAMTGGQVLDQVKSILKEVFDEQIVFLKYMESLDVTIVFTGETLKTIVKNLQELVDSVNSDYLDAMFININIVHRNLVTVLKNIVDWINMKQVHISFDYIIDTLIHLIYVFNTNVNGFLQIASKEAPTYMKVSGGRLEIELPLSFVQ